MTTNQVIAMVFPLLTVAAVFITGFFIRRPWAERKVKESIPDIKEVMASSYKDALDEAERLMRGAQRQIERARAPASKEASPN